MSTPSRSPMAGSVDAERGVGGIGVEPVGDDVVARQLEPHAVALVRAVRSMSRVVSSSDSSTSDRPTGQPAGPEEGVGHGAADEQGVDPGEQVAR